MEVTRKLNVPRGTFSEGVLSMLWGCGRGGGGCAGKFSAPGCRCVAIFCIIESGLAEDACLGSFSEGVLSTPCGCGRGGGGPAGEFAAPGRH